MIVDQSPLQPITMSILKNRIDNKDTAFTNEERSKLNIVARLPYKVETLD